MNINRSAVSSALTATAALFVLASCGGGGNSVSGNLDDTKHKAVKFKSAVRSVDVTRKQCSSARVKHTSGSGKTKRTWYANETKCRNVKVGTRTERYRKTVSAAKWCVELDNVNGKKSDDDQWYTVSQVTYLKWSDRDEGIRIKDMGYLRSGC